jgi:hypothetical protein
MEGKRFGNLYFTKKIRGVYLGKEFRVIEIKNDSFGDFKKALVLSDDIKIPIDELKTYFRLFKEKNIKNVMTSERVENIKNKTIIVSEFQKARTLSEIVNLGRKSNNPISLDNSLHIFMTIFDLALSFKNEFSQEGRTAYFLPIPDDIIINEEGAIFYQYPLCNVLLGKDKGIEKLLYNNFPFLIKDEGKINSQKEVYWFTSLFYYMITGEKLPSEIRVDTKYIASKKLINPYQSYRNIPEFIVPIIDKGINRDYKSLSQMWKDYEEIIMDGDITPSTFNLAFYYNSLFKEERKTEELEMEKEKNGPFPQDTLLIEKEKTEKLDKEIFSLMDEIEEKTGPNKGLILGIVGIVAVVILLALLIPKFINKPQTVVQQQKVDINKITQQIEQKLSEKYDKQMEQMKEDFQQKLAKAKDEEKRKALLAEQRKRIAALNKQRQQETQKTLAQVKQKIKTQQTVKKETVKSDNNNQKNKTITSANKQDKPVEQIKVQENKPQEIKPIVKEKKPEVKKPIIREGDIVPITELDKPLKILKNPSPRLTYAETKLGSVRLVMQVLVNTKGRAEKFRILRIIPQIAGLDARMRKVIKDWRFSIPTKKGIKVKTWKTIPMLIKK